MAKTCNVFKKECVNLKECNCSFEILKNNCDLIQVKDWTKLVKIFDDYLNSKDEWIFRGEKQNYESPLQPSLERVMEELGITKKIEFEKKLIFEFQRQYHRFVPNPPDDNYQVEWRALMQHYYAPSRLLDFTYSFLIAVYFALEFQKDKCACVWAIKTEQLNKEFMKKLSPTERENCEFELEANERVYKKHVFSKPEKKMVCTMNSSRLNERLVKQQGVFVCPGDVRSSFVENLEESFSTSLPQCKIRRYIIPYNEREKILTKLNRMNINRAILFPDLDGFSKSLSILPKFPIEKYKNNQKE